LLKLIRMKKIHLAQIPLFLLGILFITGIVTSGYFSQTTAHAQTAVTPTLYCLSPNCPNGTPTITPSITVSGTLSIAPTATLSATPATNPIPSVTSGQPCNASTLSFSPNQPTQTASQANDHRRGGRGGREDGFLSLFFRLFLLIIDLLLKVGGGSLPCSPSVAPSTAPSISPSVSVVPSPSVSASPSTVTTSTSPSVSVAPSTGATAPTTTNPQISGSKKPNQILTLSNWYLTLPIGAPTTISEAQIAGGYQDQYFHSDASNTGVIFYAPVTGATTTNSDHTRSELRETSATGTLPWGWSAGSGSHVMTATEAILHLPGGPGKSGRLGFAQIHGDSGTWYLILEADDNNNGTATLKVHDETNKINGTVIDPKYVLGTKFNLVFSAVNGTVTISYNGAQKASTTSTLQNAYFKIGAYNQSAGDYGEDEVYSVSVKHN
jgi:hypothetical protein